jgi:putative transposase
MKVSRSGYYEWLNRPVSDRDKENMEIMGKIKEISIQNHNIYLKFPYLYPRAISSGIS